MTISYVREIKILWSVYEAVIFGKIKSMKLHAIPHFICKTKTALLFQLNPDLSFNLPISVKIHWPELPYK